MHQTLKQRYEGSYIKTSASVGKGRGQEKAGTCGHKGRGVKQEWTPTFGSKFKYVIP